jgi:phosphoribosylformylglycinamidine synthase
LLGAFDAQVGFGLPSIGGKDSMSGTFNDIDVPPTLVSFAVDIAKITDVITPELKKAGNKLIRFEVEKDDFGIPVYEKVQAMYDSVTSLVRDGVIVSAYALDCYGILASVAKMAFGNMLGVRFESDIEPEELFTDRMGDIIAEVDVSRLHEIDEDFEIVATVTDDKNITIGDVAIGLDEAVKVWSKPLDKVFPYKATKSTESVNMPLYDAKGDIYICKNKVAKPNVFIPVFPGTNCEYDSRRAFERAGATVNDAVFKNMTSSDIRASFEEYVRRIDAAQIIMFPGGFSAGDEPDGSAKFFAAAFQNEAVKDAVMRLLNERDGLILGICNGFQALIKLGLVPNGAITGQNADSPTLTFNTVNRHISKMVYTKVVSNKSPWLAEATLGDVYVNPASHGEGRFVAPKEWLDKLIQGGQVATVYSDPDGNVSMDEEYNINGSYMAIEGITSADGRILGKMAHSERRDKGVAVNIYGEQDLKIFESGVKYFM